VLLKKVTSLSVMLSVYLKMTSKFHSFSIYVYQYILNSSLSVLSNIPSVLFCLLMLFKLRTC